MTYDANGDLVQSSGGSNVTYTWNARHQLVGISGGGITASFAYDGLGRRISKTINGTSTGFVYDGLNPVQELSGGSPVATLLTGLGIDDFISRTEGGTTSTFLTNALGSTIALTDGTGTVQTEYTYDPFGMATVTGTGSTNSYQFTGREHDGTGLLYYRARYYSPVLQRFISEDPIGFAGGDPNLYAYVTNNPLNYRDPGGLAPLEGCGFSGFCFPLDLPNNRDVSSLEGSIYESYSVDPGVPDAVLEAGQKVLETSKKIGEILFEEGFNSFACRIAPELCVIPLPNPFPPDQTALREKGGSGWSSPGGGGGSGSGGPGGRGGSGSSGPGDGSGSGSSGPGGRK